MFIKCRSTSNKYFSNVSLKFVQRSVRRFANRHTLTHSEANTLLLLPWFIWMITVIVFTSRLNYCFSIIWSPLSKKTLKFKLKTFHLNFQQCSRQHPKTLMGQTGSTWPSFALHVWLHALHKPINTSNTVAAPGRCVLNSSCTSLIRSPMLSCQTHTESRRGQVTPSLINSRRVWKPSWDHVVFKLPPHRRVF